jgi:hypothetical protein
MLAKVKQTAAFRIVVTAGQTHRRPRSTLSLVQPKNQAVTM